MPRFIPESTVKQAIHAWLNENNWRVTVFKEGRTHGPDIVAERHGHKFVIEAKGDANPRAKKPASGREVRFYSAIGQLITRVERMKAARYGLGYPESYEKLVRRIPRIAATRLNLTIFLVGERRRVRLLTARDLPGKKLRHPR
jgi:hypothetical protein